MTLRNKGIYMLKTLEIIMSILIIMGLLPHAFADDLDPHYKFSGVKATDSPYRNTWGAFQTDLFSGSFSYDHKIAVPPGTNGLQPTISIAYNSHSAKGKAGWVGSGWDIPLSYIQRDIEYTRKDTSDDTFDLFLEGSKHDLVYVPSENVYHTKVEAYLRIEKKTGAQNETGDYWIAQTKDGTEYRFGYNTDSENRVNTSDTSFTRYVWRWSLDRIKDSNGNCIYFTYSENPTPNDRGAVYLSKIEYNNDRRRLIEFILQGVDKPDMYLTVEQGSEVREARRLSEIRVKVDGNLARTYFFNYILNEAQNKSLLESITQFGAGGTSALPPVRFEYKTMDKSFGPENDWPVPGERYIRKVDSSGNVLVDTFDVNGDGLSDLVSYDTNEFYHWDIWFNNKTGFSASNVRWGVPSGWYIRDLVKYVPDEESPDTRSAPMDINRDGYIDFLKAHEDTELQVQLNNNGAGFSGVPNWPLPTRTSIREVQRPDDKAPNVKKTFLDINGDNLPDIVVKDSDTTWHIWRNTGSGFADFGVWNVPNPSAWIEDYEKDDGDVEVTTMDMNGDGLLDIIRGIANDWRVYINTGSTFIQDGPWTPPDFGDDDLIDVDDTGNVRHDLIDINGDGLPDLVDPHSGNGAWDVFINKGNGFLSKISWATPITDGFTRDVERDTGNVKRDVFDINGDGSPDIVRKTGSAHWDVYSNQSVQADLLRKVTDTLGGTIAVTYAPSLIYSNTRLPFNYWVVSAMTTNNGMSGAHSNLATTNFSYANGFYDFPTREFRGFGQVVETRADGTRVIHSYYQDEAKKGKEYRSEIKSASDAPFASAENVWNESASNGVYISNLNRTDEYTYDGNPSSPKIIRKEFQNYDSYGNVGLQVSYGDLNASGDETYTYNDYWASCSSDPWVVDKVKHSYIKPSPSGTNLRESFFRYDGLTNCAAKGNLTREEHWLNTGSNPVTTYEYDSYGNRTKTTDPEGRVARIVYDPTYNTFPDETYNALNQLTRRINEPVNGEPTYVIDPNGFTTRFIYDTFYRKAKEIRPYDSEAAPTILYQYDIDGTAPEQVKVFKRETAGGGTIDTVQVIDGFANLIQTKTESENPSNMIAVDIFYDVMGRVRKQSNPYLTDSAYAYSTPNTAVPSTVYDYDVIDRPVRITKGL